MHIVSSGGYYGAERAIVELSAGLATGGWKSLVLALDSRGTPSLVDQARLHQIPTLAVANDSGLRRLRNAIDRAIDAHEVDIVHSHGYKGDLLVATMPLRRIGASRRDVSWMDHDVAETRDLRSVGQDRLETLRSGRGGFKSDS